MVSCPERLQTAGTSLSVGPSVPSHFLQTHLYLEIFKNCYFCRQGSQLMQRLDSDQALFQKGQEAELRSEKGMPKDLSDSGNKTKP